MKLLKVACLVITILLVSVSAAFAASFTSVQDGNWADGATWGNTSPGVAGTDYPGTDGDTATIGHHVTYNLEDSTATFGNITIKSSGILEFPANANSTIYIGDTSGSNNAVLTIEAGGELRAGTSTTPIDAAYHCRFYFQRSAAGDSVYTYDGAKINLYGDPDFYGGVARTTLAADWSYSSTSLTLYVTGDCTGWKAGQRIAVDKNIPSVPSSTDYQTDVPNFEISSVGSYDSGNDRTPITLTYDASIADATFYEGGYVWMLSRNIEWSDPNSPTALYGYNSYSEVIRGCISQLNNDLINFNEVVMKGWEYCFSKEDGRWINADCVFWNCHYVGHSGPLTNMNWSGLLYSCYKLCREIAHSDLSLDFVGIECALSGTHLTTVQNVKIIGCKVVGHGSTQQVQNSEIRRCYSIFRSSNPQKLQSCNISYVYRIMDSWNPGNTSIIVNSIINPTPSVFVASVSERTASLYMENCNIVGTIRPLRIYTTKGNILPLVYGDTDWQYPPSGSDWILQATPNSYCSAGRDATKLKLVYDNDYMSYYFPSTKQHTITFKIYPYGWTSLDQDDIYIEAWYPSSSSDVSTIKVTTSTTSFTNENWQDLSVTFTNAQEGNVYFNLVLTKYESGAYVLIDPAVMIDGRFISPKVQNGTLVYDPPQKGPWGKAKWGTNDW